LIKEVYARAEKLPRSEDFILKQQLKRAIVSVALNIAEGKNRKSAKDFANFLVIAVASLAEADAVLEICFELGYLDVEQSLRDKITVLSKRINALRMRLQKG